MTTTPAVSETRTAAAGEARDAWVREVVQWHFDPATGCPFWLDFAKKRVSRLLASPLLHRLNLGPLPTMRISWDQPHEGNLFEHLCARRAFQRVGAA